MPKNWGKTSAYLTWLAILVALFVAVISLVSDKTYQYFALIAIALFGYIVYAEWLKEYTKK